MVKKPAAKIKLKPTDNIGSPAAEHDEKFLAHCFYNTGIYDTLCDAKDNKFIVLGRTGSGKTALLNEIEKNKQNVIRIDASDLCLQYLGNSNIMKFVSELGVRIDPFYEMLWRYTFIIELVNKRFNWENGKPKISTIDSLFGTKKRRGYDLLTKLAPEFWESIDKRINYIIEKTENQISSSVGADLNIISADISAKSNLSNEIKTDYKHKIERVLGHDQFVALKDAVKMLSDIVFHDEMNPYYVIIDDLDKDFAEESIRIKIIKSLIDCIKSMGAIVNVKFIIGMRVDLYELIMENSRDSGFQREKYDACLLKINWSNDSLFSLVERRINYLYASKYTKQDVRFYDIFCQEVNREKTREYILSRTLMRPRDAISFVNECITSADGSVTISSKQIKEAEKKYSIIRYEALKDEWFSIYNDLDAYTKLINKVGAKFNCSDIPDDYLYEMAYNLSIENKFDKNIDLYNSELEKKSFDSTGVKKKWIETLYKIGILGVKENSYTQVKWSNRDYTSLDMNIISNDSKLYAHKMVWSCFGVHDTTPAN